jgi:hypothetical protein
MIQRIKIDLWPKSVQMYLQGNPLFAFSFFVAFSGPVLRLMNRKGVGVIFFDPQSPCDILGPLAATVWGIYDRVRLPLMRKSVGRGSGRTASLEDSLRRHADGFLVLDQNYLRGSLRRAGQMLHEVAGYAAEGFNDGTDSSGPFVFMGETKYPADILSSASGLEHDPTQIVCIPSATPLGWGPFHNLHAFSTPSHLSVRLQALLARATGMAMSEYLTHLCDEYAKDPTGLVRWFQGYIDYYEQHVREIDSDPVTERIISIFPFFYAVAMSAVYWKKLPFTIDEVAEIVKYCENRCFRYYLDSKGKRDLILVIVNYIVDNLDQFIELPQENLDDHTFKNAPGFNTLENGYYAKFIFYPPTLRKALKSAAPQVLQACDEGGLLIRDVGSYQKKYPVWPGDYGRRNTYQIDPRILGHQPE